MIVEDNIIHAKFLNYSFINRFGCSAALVQSTVSVEGAVSLLSGNKFDLVVLDSEIVGGSGREVLKYIRSSEFNRNVPVIAQTGHLMEKAELEEQGYDAYLLKGFKTKDLFGIVKKLLLDERD